MTSDNSELDRDKLRALMKARGMTSRELSLTFTTNDSAVKNILSGKSRNPRSDTINGIAKGLDVPVSAFMRPSFSEMASVSGAFARTQSSGDGTELMVLHRAKAGTWIEADFAVDDYVMPPRPVNRDPRFPRARQWLELVDGDSINRLIADGEYAIVVSAHDVNYSPRQGDLVIVERRRNGGHLRERSVKQVAIHPDDGSVQLWPRSTNPKWSEPLVVTDGAQDNLETLEVEIVGVVVGVYRDLPLWAGATG
jgi:transcriptional regulator with XRE-family HTH domain